MPENRPHKFVYSEYKESLGGPEGPSQVSEGHLENKNIYILVTMFSKYLDAYLSYFLTMFQKFQISQKINIFCQIQKFTILNN